MTTGHGTMAVADILAIQQLISLYGHIIDATEWDRLDELFTADIVFDATDFGNDRVLEGIDAIRQVWIATDLHPVAHHATNVVVSRDADGRVRVLSKGIGVGRNGKVGSVVYRDVVRREAVGWRIAHRVATRGRARDPSD